MLTHGSFGDIRGLTKEEFAGLSVDILHQIGGARDYRSLANIAIRVIADLKSPVVKVSGPITTGGFGNPTRNLRRFGEAIRYLADQGFSVFDDRPFEDRLVVIHAVVRDGRCHEIEEFRGGILMPHLISEVRLLPGWQDSVGSKAEEELAHARGIRRVYPEQWCPEFWSNELRLLA